MDVIGEMRPNKVLAVLAALVALAACGTRDSSNGGSPPSAEPPTHLEIEVRSAPNADPEVATLDCSAEPQATGFIEDEESACRAVQDSRELLLNGPPDNVACTEIYGGPQKAEISGEVDGQGIYLGVSREDGCAIGVWDALEPILGTP
jgi:hypothetical protein